MKTLEEKRMLGSNKEVLYNCELVNNNSIVATSSIIPKGVTVYEGFPILSFPKQESIHNALLQLTAANLKSINEKTKGLYPGDSASLVEKTTSNAFQSVEMQSLYYLASKLNHSCYPNCKWLDYGDKLVFETVRAIVKGEELTHCYYFECLLLDSAKERRELIASRGNFTCECSLCRKDEEKPSGFMQSILPNLDTCASCGASAGSYCVRCKSISYCCATCQRAHWNAGHKRICKTVEC